jgi:hypothetical protein
MRVPHSDRLYQLPWPHAKGDDVFGKEKLASTVVVPEKGRKFSMSCEVRCQVAV